jgi:hypothetical protein
MRSNGLASKVSGFVHSRKFFWVILAIFALEAAWIALSSSYPMAFDEDFHFGIIRLYAQQWSPFFAHQPAGGNTYGALTSDPSYLYHYLMSFPYRLTTLFTTKQTLQIIALRFIDVGLVTWSLALFHRVLRKAGASLGMANVTLLFFSLIPVVPLLAAQINYDDLLLPLTALAILMTLQFKERLEAGTVSVGLGLKLAALCMLASLVQFEFLPIFAAIALYISYTLWQFKRQSQPLQGALKASWQLTKRVHRFAYLAIFLVAFGLFSGRYGSNLVAYKSPIPQCNQVLTVAQCSAYTPWMRNYTDALHKTSVNINPLDYTANWFRGMFDHSFFTSSSGGDTEAFYVHVPPLPVISIAAIAVFAGGVVLFLRYRKVLVAEYPALRFLLFVSFAYCATLWLWNYHDFIHLGDAVALNGRYLFPVMPLVMLALGLAYRQWLKRQPNFQLLLLGVVFALFLQGGGALTYIDASNTHWYWPNHTVDKANMAVQKIVKPAILS